MSNRNAVSPLIATVLLVMIIVSIAAGVMVVVQDSIDEQKKGSSNSCTNVEIAKVANRDRLCISINSKSEGTMALYLKNLGQNTVSGLLISVLGNNGISTAQYDINLENNNLQGFRFPFNNVANKLNELSLVTITLQSENSKTCNVQEIEIGSQIDDCDSVSWDDSIN